MGETLFIAHRIPFPPDRGDKIRSHHLLKAIAALGPTHVATFAETAGDFAAEPALAAVAQSHCLVRRDQRLARAGLRALATGRTVSETAFDSAKLRLWIARTLRHRPIDTIVVFSGQMGQFVPPDWTGRLIVDLCDVDSAKFEAYAAAGRNPRAWIDAREGRLLAAVEADLVRRADATLLVSEAEAALLRARIGAGAGHVMALGNGIDTAVFDPRSVAPHPALIAARGPHIVFTGQMDYAPNVAAAVRTGQRLMPDIRARFPTATFHVVGRAPARAVSALDGINGTRVWGEVPDVRPYLAAADIVIAPLEIARGVQNKVLEAMAMARPVVVTPEAATGIEALDGVHFAVAATDKDLVRATCDLLADGPRALAMAAAARRFVAEHKGWGPAMAPLAALMARDAGTRNAA